MKNLAFVVVAVIFSFIPVFLAQQNGIKAPITKVEVLEEGVYKYEGDTKGNVYFDHNMHQEMADCEACHEGEPATIAITDMASGHATCGACHAEVDDMDACSTCHSQ